MDRIGLLEAAKQQQGLTSDNQLALTLGITRMRLSDVRSGRKPMDEAEIFMLADLAGIDPRKAAAAVKLEREKNPAKRAYWEKISMQFAMVLISLTALLGVGVSDANAAGFKDTTCYKLCVVIDIFMGWFTRFLSGTITSLFQRQAMS